MLHLFVTARLQFNPHLQFCIILCNGMEQLPGMVYKSNDIFVLTKKIADYLTTHLTLRKYSSIAKLV